MMQLMICLQDAVFPAKATNNFSCRILACHESFGGSPACGYGYDKRVQLERYKRMLNLVFPANDCDFLDPADFTPTSASPQNERGLTCRLLDDLRMNGRLENCVVGSVVSSVPEMYRHLGPRRPTTREHSAVACVSIETADRDCIQRILPDCIERDSPVWAAKYDEALAMTLDVFRYTYPCN